MCVCAPGFECRQLTGDGIRGWHCFWCVVVGCRGDGGDDAVRVAVCVCAPSVECRQLTGDGIRGWHCFWCGVDGCSGDGGGDDVIMMAISVCQMWSVKML